MTVTVCDNVSASVSVCLNASRESTWVSESGCTCISIFLHVSTCVSVRVFVYVLASKLIYSHMFVCDQLCESVHVFSFAVGGSLPQSGQSSAVATPGGPGQ